MTSMAHTGRNIDALSGIRLLYFIFILSIPFDEYGLRIGIFHLSAGDMIISLICVGLLTLLCISRFTIRLHHASQGDIVLLMLIAMAGLVSSLINMGNSPLFIKAVLKLVLIYMLTIMLVNTFDAFDKALKMILLSALSTSFLAIFQSFFDTNFLQLGRPLPPRVIQGEILPFIRSAGPYSIYGNYGMWLVSILPVALTSLFSRKYRILNSRFFAFVALTTLLLGVVVSQTRGVWLAAAVTIVGYFLFVAKRKLRLSAIPFYFVGSMILLLIVFFISPHLIKLAGILIGVQPGTVVERLQTLNIGFSLFREHPLVGIGYSNFLNIGSEFGAKKVIHNIFVESLVSTGFMGFIPFLLFIGCILVRILKLLMARQERMSNYSLAIALGFLGVLTEAQFVRALYSAEFWMIMGMVSALHFIARRQNMSPIPFNEKGISNGENEVCT